MWEDMQTDCALLGLPLTQYQLGFVGILWGPATHYFERRHLA